MVNGQEVSFNNKVRPVYALQESDEAEREKNKSDYALYILNWLEKIIEARDSGDRDKQRMREGFLLKEVAEQARDWQISNHLSEDDNPSGTRGETVALLVSKGILLEFPSFDTERYTSDNWVRVGEDNITVSFAIGSRDMQEVKRACYIFSNNKDKIIQATAEIEVAKAESVRKEYGWKKIGSALRLMREKQK